MKFDVKFRDRGKVADIKFDVKFRDSGKSRELFHEIWRQYLGIVCPSRATTHIPLHIYPFSDGGKVLHSEYGHPLR